MGGFSVTEAALTGFRIVRERPRIALFWIVVQFFVSAGFALIMVEIAGPAMTKLYAGGMMTASRDPAQNLAMFAQLAPMYGLIMVLTLVVYPILYAAMNRAVLRPAEDGFGYFRLGADELKQFGLFVLMFLVGMAAYLAIVICMVIVSVVLAVIAGVLIHGADKAVVAGVVGLVMTLLVMAAFCGWIFVWVRLSLASALTFATGKINLFGSWALTRGRFWPMLSAYLLTFVLFLVMWIIFLAIMLPVDAALGGGLGALGAVMHPNMSSLGAYLSPVIVVNMVLGAVFSAFMWPVLLTPPAAIYQRLTLDWVGGVFQGDA